MKQCVICRRDLARSEFNLKSASPEGLQNVCRECNRQQARRYYARNRAAHLQVVMARRSRQRLVALEAVGEYLLANPCLDCGERDVRVLDFDHRVGVDKSAEVMRLAQNGYSVKRVMVEIAKCDVRCRNCHAKVTYERMGDNWRTALMRRAESGDAGGR